MNQELVGWILLGVLALCALVLLAIIMIIFIGLAQYIPRNPRR